MDTEVDRDLLLVRQSVDNARGLPNSHYISEEVYKEERQAILYGNWSGVAVGSDVPEPGDVFPMEFDGFPLLIVRDHDNEVKVYQNTCRHRGMILVEEKCNLRGTIRCPYHSWSYNLDGSLRATPHIGGPGMNVDENIVKKELGLIPIKSHVWRDIIFVNISGNALLFEENSAKLLQRWYEHEQPVFHGGPNSSFSFEVDCNWKLAVENYCESYHLPWIHPGLNSYSRLEDHYHIEEPDYFSGQGTLVYRQIEGDKGEKFPDFLKLSDFWKTGAEYIALYPNVLLATQRDHCYVILLLPQGPEKTIERIELYYSFDYSTRPDLSDLLEKNKIQWYGVLEEDLFVVEGMQKGRRGHYFDGGKFSPKMDNPTHVFHKWVADKIYSYRNGM